MNLYKINLHLETLEDGQILATSQDVPGLVAQGRTIQEAVEIAQDVARKIIESHLEYGDPLPENLLTVADSIDVNIAVAI
jgi:predicted RNase H-like HicB family nuclease